MVRSEQQWQLRRYLWRLVEVVSLLVLVVVLLVTFAWLLKYILPFVIGWFLAILLMPIVRWLERRGMRRLLAVAIVMVTAVALIVVASIYVVLSVLKEATLWLINAPVYFQVAQGWVSAQINAMETWFGKLPPRVTNGLQNSALQSITGLETTFRHSLGTFVHSLAHLPETIFVIVISLITTYFLLVHRERMYRRFLRLLPPGWSDKVQVVADDMMRAFVGTLRVQVLLMVLSAVLGVLGMWIIGVQYAVILGILFGVSGMVPILGSAILTVPWAAGAFLIGDVSLALKILLLQTVISLIRHLIEPKILADNVGLDMLSTLFALYVGLTVIGVLGLFLGPIILIGVRSLLRGHMLVDFLPQYPADEVAADPQSDA